ncbi:SKA1 protein, partial [Thinocorus orbignyianus]|nr:SKA1 protein [Thinocorus orbignyianus]
SDLEHLQLHIDKKISDVKKLLQLRNTGQDPSLRLMIPKIRQKIGLVHDLLDKLEAQVQEQEKLNDKLEELWKAAERDQNEAKHLLENIPAPLRKRTRTRVTGPVVKCEGQTQTAEPRVARRSPAEPKPIKQMALITAKEFESIPEYMKGRLKCDAINAVIEGINKAVMGKYEVLRQPLKSMNTAARNLYHRHWEGETKETKGLVVFFL